MAKLLYIEASPRKGRSASSTVAHQFLAEYQKQHPQDTVETLDLWEKPLPPFNNFVLDAKYAVLSGQSFTPEQATAWDEVVQLANHFKSADKFVISLPMWNFGVPYILKHYIDLLVQPGLTFSWTPTEGYQGLVTGKPATVIYARGGAYAPGTGAEGYDKQSDYLQHVLGFIGITDVKPVFVEPTLAGPDAKDKAVATATAQALTLAAKF